MEIRRSAYPDAISRVLSIEPESTTTVSKLRYSCAAKHRNSSGRCLSSLYVRMMMDVSGIRAPLKFINEIFNGVLVYAVGVVRAAVGIVRRKPAVVELPEPAVERQRLNLENIESGACDFS